MTQDNPRMGDLNELVERVKAATGPDRELDYAISRFADGELARHSSLHLPYTASIDAALALTERMLPGWWVQHLGQTTIGWGCRIEKQGLSIPNSTRPMHGNTAALALLAALLTALSLDTNKGDGVC